MRTKTSSRFEALTKKALAPDQATAEPVQPARVIRKPSVLAKRQESVVAAASGKIRTVKIISHDPKRIRPWAGHNRDYDALSEARCADLIEGFKRADQQFPAIVRKVSGSEDFDYEFICGARRHWTASYLQRDLNIEVRDLLDRDAFILQDIENRDREDISDYERACDYARALPIYFEGEQKRMAEQLQIDPGNFNRFMALAELPDEIVNAYADVRDLLVHHGSTYHKFLNEPISAKRLLAAAKKMQSEKLPGKKVIAELKQAALGLSTLGSTSTNRRIPIRQYGNVSLKQGRAGTCAVKFTVPKSNDEAALIELKQNLTAMMDDLALIDS